jgi:hypothetical protein
MTHQCHANLLQDAGFHKPRVEGMAEIVKTDVADTGIFQCGFPRALDDADRLPLVPDDETLILASLE